MKECVAGDLVTVDPEIMHGEPVFRGTRVPIRTLFDYLSDGDPLEEFLAGFDGITREMALGVIEAAGAALIDRSLARSA